MGWLRTRTEFEKEETERLARFALCSRDSGGRPIPEPEHDFRTAFQRDRDRVIHSKAFRRLEYKTQVFVHHEKDHYRDRLTHTIEGAQIARSIARCLRVNEDLAEAIALAHDLGHTPFGHAGERVLHECMAADGGFDHNRQSLRIVDVLEERHPHLTGLNLTQETREGILKHGCRWEHPVELPPLFPQRSIEAQVADLADEIAYINHDLDDALRAGILSFKSLIEIRLWHEALDRLTGPGALMPSEGLRFQTVRGLIDLLVADLLATTATRLDELDPRDVGDVRNADEPVLGYSPEMESAKRELKDYLFHHFYQHPRVLRMSRKAEWVVGDLFKTYRDDASLLPEHVRQRFDREGPARAIADYIAGMTDRFAMSEHRKLLDPHEPL